MKKKNGAQRVSAMSELLSKQNRNEVSYLPNADAHAKVRRGYIETLDAPELKKPVNTAARAQVSSQTHLPPQRRVYSGAENKPQRMPAVPAAVKKPSGAKKPAPAANSGTAVLQTAKIVRIALFSAAILCLCTCIISAAVLLSGSDTDEPQTDAAPGLVPDAAAELSAAAPIEDAGASENMYRVDFTFYKKDPVSCYSSDRTVGELIDMLEIRLDETELARLDMSETISSDTEINVDCVEYKTDTVNVPVDYETRYIDVQTIPRGTTQVHQQGANGTKAVEYTVTYLNGVECERAMAGERVVAAPREQIVYRGVGGTVNVGGTTYKYSYYIDCKSTVYTGGGTCATGVPASENVIAVDPGVIPLGTRVYIDGIGLRTAADTGGSIKGNFIDIYYEPGNTRFIGYGRKNVRVYIF